MKGRASESILTLFCAEMICVSGAIIGSEEVLRHELRKLGEGMEFHLLLHLLMGVRLAEVRLASGDLEAIVRGEERGKALATNIFFCLPLSCVL